MIKIKDIRFQAALIKFLFFITYCGFASWLTYFYVYLKDVPALSGFEIGIIAAFQQFNNILVVPVWGMLADRFGRKKIILISMGMSLLLLPGFLLFHQFAALLVFMIILTLVYNPLTTLLDTIGLDFEEQSKGATSYGQIRLWASFGWAFASVVTGFIINSSRISYIFPIASSIFLVSWLLIFFVYQPLTITKSLKTINHSVIPDLFRANKRLFQFLVLVFVYSILSAPIYLFINMYYHEIGAQNYQIGIAFAVQGMSELPLFFFGKRIIKRFGPRKVFLFTMIATAIRLAAYSFTTQPFVAVGIGIIHGISIALFFLSMIEFVHNIVPSDFRSTGQSLIYTFYAGGICFGNLLIGLLDDYISIRSAMLFEAIGILALVLVVMGVLRTGKINNEQPF